VPRSWGKGEGTGMDRKGGTKKDPEAFEEKPLNWYQNEGPGGGLRSRKTLQPFAEVANSRTKGEKKQQDGSGARWTKNQTGLQERRIRREFQTRRSSG